MQAHKLLLVQIVEWNGRQAIIWTDDNSVHQQN